ncbi:MAG: hypothetical protein RJB60_1575 [Pseudomonadota bacterium]|jgi:hypothetical protein
MELSVKKHSNLLAMSLIFLLALPAAQAGPSTWVHLVEASCQPHPGGSFKGSWPSSMDGWLQHAKACPLVGRAQDQPKVWLLSVWAQSYLDANPAARAWPDFPRPQLVDSTGRCLAVLPELFPLDEPRGLIVSYVMNSQGRPAMVRVRVDNPAQGGGYALPQLNWREKAKAYEALKHTREHKITEFSCPS